MLTKWGSALGLASASRIVSLSGSSPLGDATVWGAVGTWSELSTIPAGDIRNNDEVPVNTLGTSHSSGVAQRHGAEWRLIEGKWATVADMNNWTTLDVSHVVHANAIGLVKSGGTYNDNSVAYIYHSSNWVRFAGLTAGYAWQLSSLQDFSAIGLEDGDFGIFTQSGGTPITVRYKADCDIPGDGTVPIWLPPVVYAGTPLIKAYLIGDETNIQLGNKGWTITTIGTGTVGTVDGYIRLDGPTGALSQGAIAAPAITGANRFYLVGDFRGSASGSDPYVGIFGNASAGNPAQYALGRGQTSGFIRQLTMPSAAWAVADTLSQIQGASISVVGLNWPATVPYLVQALSGDVIFDLIESRFDGKLYSSFRRNFDGAVDASSYAFQLLALGGGGGTASRLELRNLYLITY